VDSAVKNSLGAFPELCPEVARQFDKENSRMTKLEIGRRLTEEVLNPMKRDFVGKDEVH